MVKEENELEKVALVMVVELPVVVAEELPEEKAIVMEEAVVAVVMLVVGRNIICNFFLN